MRDRPWKLTPERHRQILAARAAGVSVPVVAREVGCSTRSVYRYMVRPTPVWVVCGQYRAGHVIGPYGPCRVTPWYSFLHEATP